MTSQAALVLAVLGANFAPVARAGEAHARDLQIEKRCNTADKNGDGKLRQEATKASALHS